VSLADWRAPGRLLLEALEAGGKSLAVRVVSLSGRQLERLFVKTLQDIEHRAVLVVA
jgi:hypothetical protein